MGNQGRLGRSFVWLDFSPKNGSFCMVSGEESRMAGLHQDPGERPPVRTRRFPVGLAALAWVIAVGGAGGLLANAVTAADADAKGGFRKLAPGVLTVIPPDRSADDTEQRGDLLEITRGLAARKWTPRQAAANATLVELAKNREFQRDIWCLEFAFKPPRMIDVDVPVSDLRMQRKRLWYLLYRVRNAGGRRTVVKPDDPTSRSSEAFEKPVRFLPHFVLESLEPLADAEGNSAYRAYLDRVVPAAMEPIRRREDPALKLYDSASMADEELAPGEERWGVAVWEDIDPRLDFFSIFIRGLTNSIRWRERADADFSERQLPGSGMEQTLECLRLDFWRPGDDRREVEEEMRVGYAGMFERMSLGSRLLEAAGRPRMTKSAPLEALDELGLSWSDLQGTSATDLTPLDAVVKKLAAIREPAGRAAVARALFGDPGAEYVRELWPVLTARDGPERKAALRASPRLDSLLHDLAIARTLDAMEALSLDPRTVADADALEAFVALRTVADAEADADKRKALLDGLFGPRGSEVYAAATAAREGIDHSWVFRYEIDD
jgi:hypothetical protein